MTGPGVGDEVMLVVPGVSAIGARVDAVEGETLALTKLDGGIVPLPRARARLRFTNGRGVCSVEGTVTGAEPRLAFARSGEATLIQRREHVRVEATVAVSYRPAPGVVEQAFTLNVSGGGFALADATRVTLGDRLHFTLDLDDPTGPIDVHGTAARAAGETSVAVRIDAIAPGDRERLIHWIFQRQRLVRAMRTGR